MIKIMCFDINDDIFAFDLLRKAIFILGDRILPKRYSMQLSICIRDPVSLSVSLSRIFMRKIATQEARKSFNEMSQ